MQKDQNRQESVSVKIVDDGNKIYFERSFPKNTAMVLVKAALQNDANLSYKNTKDELKIIGFQSQFEEKCLFDFLLFKGVGKLTQSLTLHAIYQQSLAEGLSRYKLLKCLATGGFSKVYLARSISSGQFFAAKFIDKTKVSTQDKKVLIMNEKKVNEMSDHPFLVKMHEFIQTENFYVLIMDYCPGGELFYMLRSINRMTEKQARIYFVEVLLGIQYLHGKGIMYRDLKPENIMIDENGHIKIADFGLAKTYRKKSYSFCGSIQYMSPQIVTNLGHSLEVDFYCLGALLFQLLVGCPPFYNPQLSEQETKQLIAQCQVQFPIDIHLSQGVKDLIRKLLTKNPRQRIGHFGGTKQIMMHSWIGKLDKRKLLNRQFDVPFKPDLCKFNFDPDQIGMSQQRFTGKIKEQYRILNHCARKISTKTEKSFSLNKRKKSLQSEKLVSPYKPRPKQQSNTKSCLRISFNEGKTGSANSKSVPYLQELIKKSISLKKKNIKRQLSTFHCDSLPRNLQSKKNPNFFSKQNLAKLKSSSYAYAGIKPLKSNVRLPSRLESKSQRKNVAALCTEPSQKNTQPFSKFKKMPKLNTESKQLRRESSHEDHKQSLVKHNFFKYSKKIGQTDSLITKCSSQSNGFLKKSGKAKPQFANISNLNQNKHLSKHHRQTCI